MKRPVALAALALLLAACGAPARLTPAHSVVKESLTAQLSEKFEQLPTPVVIGMVVRYATGDQIVCMAGVPDCPVLEVASQPTPTPVPQTAIPTNTLRPTMAPTASNVAPSATPLPTATFQASSTPNLTPTQVIPTPTPQGTVASTTPAPTPTPITACFAGISASTLNVRTGPGTSFGLLGQVHSPDRVQVVEVQFVDVTATRTDEWARIKFGTSTGFIAVFYDGGTNAVYDLSEDCNEVRFPPPKVGLHLIFSAQSGPVMALIDRNAIGSLKGTDGAEWIVKAAKQANPRLLTIWRNLATGLGWRDNPAAWNIGDPRVVADQWFDAQYGTWKARGLVGVVDYFEYRNEALFVGAWEVAFDLRMLERANAAGVCLALFSDGFGNPQISEFVQRRAVLDAILAHPCAPGRYHAIAYHTYEGVDGGAWKFGRFSLFLLALGEEKYRAIPWLITEYSYSDGRGAVDCGALWDDQKRAKQEYARWPMVWSYAIYSVGPGTVWQDVTSCLPGLK